MCSSARRAAAARAGAPAAGGRSSPQTRATGSRCTRSATGSTSCWRTRTSCGSRSCICGPTTRASRRRRSPNYSEIEHGEGEVVVGETTVRFVERRTAARGSGRELRRRAVRLSADGSVSRRRARIDSLRGSRTYEAAGVSLAAAEEVVERLRAAVESTRTPAVEGSSARFAGLYPLDERRLLAASTDSVGTKLVLSRRARPAARLRRATSPPTASTTCSRPARSRSSCSTTSPPTSSTSAGRRARRGRRRGLPRGRLRADRRRDRRAARRLPRGRARLRRHVRRDRRAGAADRRLTLQAGDVVLGLRVLGAARERLLARALARRRRATSTPTCCSRPTSSTSTRCARSASGPT